MELTLRRQKTLFFPFKFQGPKQRVKYLEKYSRQYFGRRKTWERRKQANEGRKPKIGGSTGLCTWPRGAHHLGPRRSAVVDLFSTDIVLT